MKFKFSKAPANVTFTEKGHKYSDQNGKEYISVTTLLGQYHKPFDTEYWSTYKGVKDTLEKINIWGRYKSTAGGWQGVVSYFNKNGYKLDKNIRDRIATRKQFYVTSWKDEGDLACKLGNIQHNSLEKLVLSHKKISIKGKRVADVSPATLLDMQGFCRTGNSIHPELLLWNEKYRLAGQADLVEKTGNEVVIKDYKGVPLDTPIMTSNGWVNMSDIKEGSLVFDKNGKQTEVEHVSKIHLNPCYKITFDTNESIVSDHEHKWEVTSRQRDGNDYIKNVTTEEIFDYYKASTGMKIKNPDPIEFETKDLPIDPYLLGIWLGDGSKASGIISNSNSNIWDEISKRGYDHGDNISSSYRSESRTVYGLRTKIREGGLLFNKHIPDQYLMGSFNQRLDLLRGLMDSDGHYNKTRKRYVMVTTQDWQAYDFATLLSTLGIKATIITAKGKLNNKIFDCYHTCFGSDINPFLVRNKECDSVVRNYRGKYRYIKKVELVETVPTRCISVKSDSHTYLVGKTLIPTHNTCKEIKMDPFMDTMMLEPLQYLPDTNYSKFTMQLSTYGWMLEQLGYKVAGVVMIHIDRINGQVIREYPLAYRPDLVEKMLENYERKGIRKFN